MKAFEGKETAAEERMEGEAPRTHKRKASHRGKRAGHRGKAGRFVSRRK